MQGSRLNFTIFEVLQPPGRIGGWSHLAIIHLQRWLLEHLSKTMESRRFAAPLATNGRGVYFWVFSLKVVWKLIEVEIELSLIKKLGCQGMVSHMLIWQMESDRNTRQIRRIRRISSLLRCFSVIPSFSAMFYVEILPASRLDVENVRASAK